MFRNSTLQRIIASALLTSFASSTLAPVVAFAQNSASFTLQPLAGTPGRGLPGLDANGIPTGKGWQRNAATNTASATTAAPTQAYGFALAQLESMALKADSDLAAGRGSDALAQATAVRTQYARLKQEEPVVAQAFAATEAHLRAAGLASGEILARHQQAVQDFNARNAELKAAMAALDAAAVGKGSLQPALNQLAKLMKQHSSLSGQGAQGKGHAWGRQKKAAPPVAMTARQHERRFPRSVLLAAAGSLSGITLPDAILPDTVQPGDLAEQGEVVLTPAVRALAAQLGNSPVAIYNWVRNNIAYAPGFGAMQDADATLLARRGNATDTAGLLIALNRAAGIPSRYVYGTIEVPLAKVQNWLDVDSAAAAQALLAQSGIPHRAVAQAGQVGALQLEHVWVEAYVDYSPSRGGVNKTPGAWVPLDASFKQMDSKAGLDLANAVSLNEAGLLSQVRQGAVCTPDYAQNLNLPNLQAGYTDFKTRLNGYLGQQGADLTVGDVLGNRHIAARNYGILLGSLPYAKVAQGAIVNTLPDNLRWQFRLQLFASAAAQAANTPAVSYSGSLAAVANKRLTLSFAPASQADADVLASYMPKAHADGSPIQPDELPMEVPGYLVRVKAEIRADGEVVASGGSFVLGSDVVGGIASFDPSSGTWNESAFGAHAGDYHAVAIDAQGVAAGQLAALKARLNATQAKLASGQAAGLTRDDVSGDLLYHAALGYFATVDANAGVFQRAARVVEQRLPSYGRAVAQAQPEMVLGIVNKVRFPGVVLDIDRLDSAVAQNSGGLAPAAYTRQANERNAAYGHLVLAKLFTSAQTPGQAASPVKALNAAASAGSKVFAVTSANAASVLPQVDIAAAAAADIQNTVAAGSRALVAQAPVNIGNWNGHGLVMEDANGAGSYRLHGEAGYATSALYLPNGTTWLALAEPAQAATAAAPAAQAAQPVNDTLASLLGETGSTTRWSFYAGQADVASGLFLARLAAGQGSGACDILTGTIAAGLDTSGGFDSGAVAGAPVITSAPVINGGANQLYNYAVQATDPKGAALAYALREAPTGMAISADGVISWTKPVAGTWNVTVRADNGRAYAEQRYQLTVGQQVPLDANLKITPQVINLGETVTIDVLSTGGSGNVTRSLTIDGQEVALTVEGRATVTGTAIGAHQITAKITDSISTTTRVGTYSVRDPADSTTPVAQITAPVDDAEVTAPVNVTGTATATNLAYYQLLLRPAGGNAWSEIARGTSAVANGVLGKLDPTQLSNGIYEMVLNVVDANGRQQTQMVTLDVYRDLKIGQFALTFEDLNVEASGIPIRVTRTYDSRRKNEALDFGYGWSVDYQSVKLQKNMVLGLQWNVVAHSQVLTLCIVPSGKRKINLTLPDGRVERFVAKNRDECAFVQVPPVNIELHPLPGTNSRLEIINVPTVIAQGGQLYDMDNLETWNPKEFKLTTEDNYVYYIREGVGIVQIKDPVGNVLTYGQNGILHSSGQSVAFLRDAKGRIASITDPAGKAIRYTYDASGDLTAVSDRVGAVSRFSYNRTHGMTEYTDPMGALMSRYVYDEEGRVIAVFDSTGKAIELNHDIANNREVVKDRRGNQTSYQYDAAGNITEVIDALQNKSVFTYDANGNQTSAADPLGNVTTRTFSSGGKQLTEVNPLGHTNKWEYDGSGTLLMTTEDARGNKTSFNYGENGYAIFEPLGRTSSVGFGSQGNIASMSLVNATTTFAYDAKGNPVKVTGPDGNVRTSTFDANGKELSRSWQRKVAGKTDPVIEGYALKRDAEGRVVEATDAMSVVTKAEYNAGGLLTASIDAAGRRTTFEYDARGKPVKKTYPDGTWEAQSFDAEGNRVSMTDRQGRVTRYEYDALNRLVRTTYPTGLSEGAEYDAAGRIVANIDGAGRRSTSKFDAAGQVVEETDEEGRTSLYAYDAAGNRISVTNGAGEVTNYTYDALNRPVKVTTSSGESKEVSWAANGAKLAEVAADGSRIEYENDALGRLKKVRQTVGQTTLATTYEYDSVGNKVAQVDSEGRTTTWEYDAKGRLLAHVAPGGQRRVFSYDVHGNLGQVIDADQGVTQHAYDADNRLILTVRPDGARIARTYSAAGMPLTINVANVGNSGLRSGTTSFHYDQQDQLVRQENPDGSYIAYAYDANGNVIERTTKTATVRYTNDAAGRVLAVTDPSGGKHSYVYDAAGRVASFVRPNGLTTRYAYNQAGRIIQITHVAADGSLQFAVRYTLSANGKRTAVQEYDQNSTLIGDDLSSPARTLQYAYDGAGRLVQERVTARNGTTVRTSDYAYDTVGNRLKKVETTEAGSEVTSYMYDVNDRLLSSQRSTLSGSTVQTSYVWDPRGNLLSKITGTNGQFFNWDSGGRLIEVRQGASAGAAKTVALFRYDADGNRVRKIVPIDGGEEAVTDYLVDSTFDYAQVLEEDRGGSEVLRHIWSNELIADQGAQQTYFLTDAIGSVRQVVGSNGALKSNHEFGAFGERTGASQSSSGYGFANEYFDADIGLQYNRARWYSAEEGRFISVDPYEGDLDLPLSLHRYVYAALDPIANTDPSGETNSMELSAVSNIQGTMSSSATAIMQHMVRKFLIGDPKKGDFGLIGELVLEACIGAVDDAINSTSGQKVSKRKKGTLAHAFLSREIERLNKWLANGSITRNISVFAEVSRMSGGRSAYYGQKGSYRIDVLVYYKKRPAVAFDLKTGAGVQSGIGNLGMPGAKRAEYQRRFKTRVYTVGVAIP